MLASNRTSDVMGKLTVLATLIVPCNFIAGVMGMNVYVPFFVSDYPGKATLDTDD